MWHHRPLGRVMGTTGLDPEGWRSPFLVIHLGWESQRWAEEEGGVVTQDYHLRTSQESWGYARVAGRQ